MKKGNKKLVFAAIRAAIALVIALALVIVSGFAFVYQLGGATEVTDGAQLDGNSYVSADIKWVMDVVGTETSRASGKVLYYYVVAPVGNRFTLLRVSADQLEDVQALKAETTALLVGESKAMTIHMPVRGMVAQAEQGAYSLLNSWFNDNIEWMTIAGVVGEEPSAADYLVDECILVDQVGAFGEAVSAVLSIAAALFVLYALVECALMAAGHYKESRVAARMIKRVQREKAKAKAQRAAERAAEKAKAKAEAREEKPAVTEEAEVEAKPVTEEAKVETVTEEVTEEAETETEAVAEEAKTEPVESEAAEAETAAEEATVEAEAETADGEHDA